MHVMPPNVPPNDMFQSGRIAILIIITVLLFLIGLGDALDPAWGLAWVILFAALAPMCLYIVDDALTVTASAFARRWLRG